MARFKNRVCIITGGASGIGAETARRYVRDGGRVVIGDVDEALGGAIADEIGDAAAFTPIDVADPKSCAAGVAFAIDALCGTKSISKQSSSLRAPSGPAKRPRCSAE